VIQRILERLFLLTIVFAMLSTSDSAAQQLAEENARDADAGEWTQLFNGKDLQGWIVKLNHHELGDNFGDTFRVEDGLIKVRYDKYDEFGERFGHLFYGKPFSHYHMAVEYRITGEPCEGTPDWAVRNSGVMLHCLAPQTMLVDQDFPISLELQFLAGLGDDRPRATGNLCTPGTHVVYEGQLTRDHIIQSSAPTFALDEWVRAEAIVRGNESITHLINGDVVLEYTKPEIGGGVVNGHDPEVFEEGKLLDEGYISLQSEGHPIDFRRVELQVLEDGE
jgi:hypothetical protein